MESAWNSLKNFDFSNLPGMVEDFATNVAPNMIKDYLPKLLTSVLTNMVTSVLPFMDAVPLLDQLLGATIGAAMNAAFDKGSGSGSFSGLADASTSVWGKAQNLISDTNDLRAAEVPGVLVYANSITMGDQVGPTVAGRSFYNPGTTQCFGLFVARGSCDLRTDYTIGAAASLNGSVTAKNLLYYPPFTTCSVYLPKNMGFTGGNPDRFWKQAFNIKYGSDIDSNQSIDLPEKPRYYPVMEAWQP